MISSVLWGFSLIAAVIAAAFTEGNVVRNNMLVPFLQSGGVNEWSMGGLDAFVLQFRWVFDVSMQYLNS